MTEPALSVEMVTHKTKELLNQLFLNLQIHHIHLDWLTIDDILDGEGVCFILYRADLPSAFLALEKNNEQTFWVHSFGSSENGGYLSSWNELINAAAASLQIRKPIALFSIPTVRWFELLLENSHFLYSDRLLTFHAERKEITSFFHKTANPPCLNCAPIIPADLEAILTWCESAFPPLWRLSPKNLEKAISHSNYALKIETDHALAGYLLATEIQNTIHINRIAVSPNFFHKGVGNKLVSDLLNDPKINPRIHSFSANTNKNNRAAVAFYKRCGFLEQEKNAIIYRADFLNSTF